MIKEIKRFIFGELCPKCKKGKMGELIEGREMCNYCGHLKNTE